MILDTIKPNLRKRIELEVNAEFYSAYEALESLGYTELEEKEQYKGKYYKVFRKDGKEYVYRGMDHFNTYIYSVTISPIEEEA